MMKLVSRHLSSFFLFRQTVTVLTTILLPTQLDHLFQANLG
jgi:hypothetical protein